MYWQSFKTFFKIGVFTLKGNYAMLPVIEAEFVDKHKYITKSEFTDIIEVAQSCPGVFAINISTFVGYKINKLPGAICTTFATALPSFLIILLIAILFHSFQNLPIVEPIFKGIRPAVVALIAVPTLNIAIKAKLYWTNFWIPLVSAILIWLLGVNPIFIILASGIGGFIYGQYIKPTE